MPRAYPREWLPTIAGRRRRNGWRAPGQAQATAGLEQCATSKPSKYVPAAALAPLVVVTVTVGDEEPFCRAVKN